MIDVLEYHGRPMNSDTITGASVKDVARVLRRGSPVSVELEPGDGTYYNFLVVPVWAPGVIGHLGRYGMPESRSRDYMFVTKVDDTGGMTWVLWSWFEVGDLHIHHQLNPWTAQIMTWWFKMLWAEIKAL